MTEHYSDRPHPEPVVLEIGDDLGALVVYTRSDLHGAEIEISRVGEDAQRSHKEVLNRPVAGRPTYAAVFDQLSDGSYTLWSGGQPVATDVVIAGGSITELDWRAERSPRLASHHHDHHSH